MNERAPDNGDPGTEATQPTPHEREVAQYEEEGTGGRLPSDDATLDPARRPTAEEDLAADRRGADDEEED